MDFFKTSETVDILDITKQLLDLEKIKYLPITKIIKNEKLY